MVLRKVAWRSSFGESFAAVTSFAFGATFVLVGRRASTAPLYGNGRSHLDNSLTQSHSFRSTAVT